MPLLWRYLMRGYLRVFFLCVTGFISVLLVIRFQTIARFASTGASKLLILKFILYQIPYILPLAIPISCLISALILFQRMSRSHELTALRVAGGGLGPIAYPLLVTGALMSLFNFSLVSEIGPKCRARSKALVYEMVTLNPLCLLQKETLIKLKNTFIDMKVLKSGEYAEDVIIIARTISNQRLGMMLAKKLSLHDQNLNGSQVSFISTIDPKDPDHFDHLVIENQEELVTKSDQVTQYLRTSDWNFNYDYLNLRMLQAKNASERQEGEGMHPKVVSELARRLSLGLAAFTFTLLGIAFGIQISRDRKTKGILWATGLAVLFLISFIAAKSIKHDLMAQTLCYLVPHSILILLSLWSLRKVSRGYE
ncbi:MAG: hypothetical protein KR126chlam1_00727 [Chlamydiae bacterium]|nr:hypothetical protein [Chlamydiota bacterium]